MAGGLTPAAALAGVNLVLLTGLSFVWLRNYRTFRTPMALGLLAFGVVLALENALALYYFFRMEMLYAADPVVQQSVTVLRALQFVAVAVLTYVTTR
jgi:hypothetical protein